MDRSVRLATTYYRNFVLLVVLPLLVTIGLALWFLRGNTLDSSVDKIELAQHNIIAALISDVENAVLQFGHLLETGGGRLQELSSRVFAASGQERDEAMAELLEFYELISPPGLKNIAAVHFYAKNASYFNIKAPVGENTRIRTIRASQFYAETLKQPGKVHIGLTGGDIVQQERTSFDGDGYAPPLITVSYAPLPKDLEAESEDGSINSDEDLTELICFYITTRAYEMLRNFGNEPGQGDIYLIDERREIIMTSALGHMGEVNLPDNIPWTSRTYSAVIDGGQYSCIVRVIEDDYLNINWKLVSIVGYGALLADFNRIALVVAGISILLFILYFIFSARFLKNIVRPLHSLISGMEKMEQQTGKGDLAVYVELSGQREMRELIGSFNEMTSHIGDLMRIKEGIFKASPVGLIMFGGEYNIIDCNETLLEMFGVAKSYYFSNYDKFSPEYQPDGSNSKDKFGEIMKRALNGEEVVTEWLFRSGETGGGESAIPCEITLSRTEMGGKYTGLGFVYDLRSIKSMENNIRFLESEVDKINYDALTGIYNRRYYDKQLELVIKSLSRAGGTLSLMMIDVDCFKQYNDQYGHSQGDDCLRAVAKTLKETVTRADDFAVRYGGEEFSVVLPNTDEKGAGIIAGEILENIRKLNIIHEYTKVEGVNYITVSIGVTTGVVGRSHKSGDYIKRADAMLYHAKHSGRNRYASGPVRE
ncbi:MAG: diguanylate cyclase [Oscillospiraceae bacterium]|nr:diguanylate cyclase [Oscillospiraceae bacterium]